MAISISSQTKKKLTIDERIAFALTDRKILNFRYDAHLRQEVLKRLNRNQKSLLNRIAIAGVEALPKRELDKLLKELNSEIAKTYQELTAYTDKALSGFFTAEKNGLRELYQDQVGFDFFNQVPAYQKKAIQQTPIVAGAPLESWWAKQGADLSFKFEATIRQGLIDGKSTADLIGEVKEVFGTSRRYAETLVVTAVGKVADSAHEALRNENLDLIKGERHLSTLDMRTSTVCQLRDGLEWDIDKQPIGHNVPYQRPPLHPRCRSILQLVLKSWKELGIDVDEEPPQTTRASQDGPVNSNLNYENWLKSKTPEEQDRVLGKGKADLWRRGVITFSDMLDQSGRPLTLSELQDDRLVQWISNKRYQAIQQAVQKLPKFAETVEKYGLTQEEGSAIYAYTTNLYNRINPKMRAGKLTQSDQGFISVVEQGLAKLPSFEGITYRRVDLSKVDLARYQVGTVVTEKAFTSSSKKADLPDFKGYVQFVITGKNGKFIQHLSKYPKQYEVLFGENAQFRVVDYQENSRMGLIVIEMEEL